MQVIRQRYWMNPDAPETSWRATNSYCVTESGDNTGYEAWSTLEEYTISTGEATGVTKPNVDTEPEYVAPVENQTTCPIPEPEPTYSWRAIDPKCTKTNGENTGEKYWENLEEYEENSGQATGEVRANDPSDPYYVSPVTDTQYCPLPPPPEPVYKWRGINLNCVQDDNENTGYQKYDDLEEYDEATGTATGNVKPNVSFDPDYIAPVYNETACPLPEPQYTWEGYEPYCVIKDTTPKIENTTKIVLLYDNSNSMDTTIDTLQDMIDGPLKTKLLSKYDSETDYYNRVISANIGVEERFLDAVKNNMNTDGDTICFIFQNEAYSSYEPFTASNCNIITDIYKDDLNDLDVTVGNYAYNLTAFLFGINTPGEYEDFELWLNCNLGKQGAYTGTKSLANKDYFNVVFDVQDGETAQFYVDLIVNKLNELGYEI